MDPEYYLSHRLTEKSDIYSLGIVFLEILTGILTREEHRPRGEGSVGSRDDVVGDRREHGGSTLRRG